MENDLRQFLQLMADEARPLDAGPQRMLIRARRKRFITVALCLSLLLGAGAAIYRGPSLLRTTHLISPAGPAPGTLLPGWYATVNGHHFEPIYVGEYLGRTLPKDKNRGCGDNVSMTRRGGLPESAYGPYPAGYSIDEQCRVFVISEGKERRTPGGTTVHPSKGR